MFLYRLAGHLGMTVRRLRQELSDVELTHWMAYFELEPFGEAAEWWRHGDRQAFRANTSPYVKRKKPPYKISDFQPQEPE